MISEVTDWYSKIKPHILGIFRNSPNMLALLQLIASIGNDCEAGLHSLYSIMDYTQMTGTALDVIGTLLGVSRNNLTDVEYRAAILLSISTVRSATPEGIRNYIKNITGSDVVFLYGNYPAGFWVLPNYKSNLTYSGLESATGAGIQPYVGGFLARAADSVPILRAADGQFILVVDKLRDEVLLTDDGYELITDTGEVIQNG